MIMATLLYKRFITMKTNPIFLESNIGHINFISWPSNAFVHFLKNFFPRVCNLFNDSQMWSDYWSSSLSELCPLMGRGCCYLSWVLVATFLSAQNPSFCDPGHYTGTGYSWLWGPQFCKLILSHHSLVLNSNSVTLGLVKLRCHLNLNLNPCLFTEIPLIRPAVWILIALNLFNLVHLMWDEHKLAH